MSYLSELLRRRITAAQFLGKSVAYLKQRASVVVPSDAEVDTLAQDAERAAELAASAVQAAFAAYIRSHAPLLPADVIAAQAATVGLHLVDAAISGAANVVKANN